MRGKRLRSQSYGTHTVPNPHRGQKFKSTLLPFADHAHSRGCYAVGFRARERIDTPRAARSDPMCCSFCGSIFRPRSARLRTLPAKSFTVTHDRNGSEHLELTESLGPTLQDTRHAWRPLHTSETIHRPLHSDMNDLNFLLLICRFEWQVKRYTHTRCLRNIKSASFLVSTDSVG